MSLALKDQIVSQEAKKINSDINKFVDLEADSILNAVNRKLANLDIKDLKT